MLTLIVVSKCVRHLIDCRSTLPTLVVITNLHTFILSKNGRPRIQSLRAYPNPPSTWLRRSSVLHMERRQRSPSMESHQSENARRYKLYNPQKSPLRRSHITSGFWRYSMEQNCLSVRNVLTVGTELAGIFQVDVPFLLQQAQLLYEKQLEELQLQMQRVNSSTSVLGHSKGLSPLSTV